MNFKRAMMAFLMISACALIQAREQQALSEPSISVYFSPNGGCTEAIVNAIGTARHSILVQSYEFTSRPIAVALIGAYRRGVDVRIIMDKSQSTDRYSDLGFLRNAGIPIWIDAAHAIAHNKIIIIDNSTTITGSFNFTRAAESRNAENLLIILDHRLANAYTQNWVLHQSHSYRI